LKVAELLFNNDFKEAYAIKGGLRGAEGWQVSYSSVRNSVWYTSIFLIPSFSIFIGGSRKLPSSISTRVPKEKEEQKVRTYR
jgi:hypothetical protein